MKKKEKSKEMATSGQPLAAAAAAAAAGTTSSNDSEDSSAASPSPPPPMPSTLASTTSSSPSRNFGVNPQPAVAGDWTLPSLNDRARGSLLGSDAATLPTVLGDRTTSNAAGRSPSRKTKGGRETKGKKKDAPRTVAQNNPFSFGMSQFQPTTFHDLTTKLSLQSITAMPGFSVQSFEELRVVDYAQRNRESMVAPLPLASTVSPASASPFRFSTGTAPFEVTSLVDGLATIHFQSISAMPQYRDLSHEELRVADYSRRRHDGVAATSSPALVVGASSTPSSSSVFGPSPLTALNLTQAQNCHSLTSNTGGVSSPEGQTSPVTTRPMGVAPTWTFPTATVPSNAFGLLPSSTQAVSSASALSTNELAALSSFRAPACTCATLQSSQAAPAPPSSLSGDQPSSGSSGQTSNLFGINAANSTFTFATSGAVELNKVCRNCRERILEVRNRRKARQNGRRKSAPAATPTPGMDYSRDLMRARVMATMRSRCSLDSGPGYEYYQQVLLGNMDNSLVVPKLTKKGYEISPSIDILSTLPSTSLGAVSIVVLKRPGYGKVEWEGAIDLRGANLDDIVVIEREHISIYGQPRGYGRDDIAMPAAGTKLNHPAVLTFFAVFPRDDAHIDDSESFAKYIETKSRQMGAEFLSYDRDAGIWKIRVRQAGTYSLQGANAHGLTSSSSTNETQVASTTTSTTIPSDTSGRSSSSNPTDPEVRASLLEAEEAAKAILAAVHKVGTSMAHWKI